jgi:hypothetical protein
MKNIITVLLVIWFIGSCNNAPSGRQLAEVLQETQLKKTMAEKQLTDFKARESGFFKFYDSLKVNGKLDSAIKATHDSLFSVGIGLDMQIVHCQMKIDSLQGGK